MWMRSRTGGSPRGAAGTLHRLLRGGVVALLIGALGACGSSEEEARARLEKAQEYQRAGDIRAAIIEYKNALQENPDLARARWLLGSLYLTMGDAGAARKELERARELGLDEPGLDKALATARILQGAFKEALELAEASPTADSDPDWLALRGEALLGLGRTEAAGESFSRAIELRPDHGPARRGLARIKIVQGELEGARQEVEAALASAETDLQTWLLKGELELSLQRLEEAERAFRKAIEINEHSAVARLGLARVLIAQRKTDEAAKAIDAVAGSDSNDPRVNYLRALIARQRNDLGSALDSLRKVLAVAPEHEPSLLLAGQIHYLRREFEQAAALLGRYVKRVPANIAARKLLAAVQIELNQPGQAIETLSPAESAAPDDPQVLSLLGTAYMRLREFDKGTEYLERASEQAPDAAPIRTQLAISHLVRGEDEAAIEELETAIEADPSFSRADFLLVLTHLRKREFDQALAAARRLAEKRPDSPQARNLVAAALEASGDLEAARAAYRKAGELAEDFLPAKLNLARLDLREGKIDAARTGFEAVLKIAPDNPTALVALARIASAKQQPDKALELLEQARTRNPKAIQPRLILTAYYLRQQRRDKALELAREAQAISPRHPAANLLLGRALLANGESAEAERILTELTRRLPDSADAHFQLALAHAQRGNLDGARAELTRTLELRPGNVNAQATLSRVELQAGNHDRALELAAAVRKQAPDSALGWILEGDIRLARSEPEAALAAYRKAFAKSASTATVLRLAAALRRGGDQAGALRELERWVDANPDDATARLVLASTRHRAGDKARALKDYEAVIERQPGNVVALNNLAWLYYERKDPRALELAKRAYDRFAERAEIIDTYGWLLVEDGQVEQGLKLLERAVDRAPDNPDIRYHRAAALARSGEREQARAELEALLGQTARFSERGAAEALLEELR